MKEKMTVEFCAISSNESFARICIGAFFAKLDPTVEELSSIKLAVSEAVTNSIVHGYQKNKGNIYIECEIDNNVATIKVTDKGIGIKNVDEARKPLFTTNTDNERSGMGFTVMETFMDSLEVYSKEGEGTVVVMSKKIGIKEDEK